ncbi:hypothetical protein IPM65_04985 [Candidatus Roizmanbacteria bacterium]|nr:MAG: hypothetical protein IPM65_04985 [Candidatus Roizmanbacteria bacterium]
MNDILSTSIIRFIRKRYPYLIFFLLSLAPFAWHSNLFQVQFIGSADYLSPYVTQEWIAQTTSVYGPQVGGGGDYAYLLAYLFLYNLPVLLLHTLGMSGPVISISILATMLFVSQLSMYLFVKYVIQEKLQQKNISISLITTFGAVLYGFSPYLVGIIAPGHIFQIYSYMTFPLILLFTDKFLSSKKYKLNYLISIYYIFFLSSPAFANIGILYVTFLILGGYYLLFNIFNRKKLIITTVRTFLIFLSAIFANIWWILPYAANFGKAVTINQASTTINEVVNTAVKHASVTNIFFGRAESLFFEGLGNTFYSNGIIFLLFTGLLLLAFVPYITKNAKKGYLYLLSLLLLLGAFITKGPNDPFGFLFNWMYYTIPGFQIFRRPVSKFYWFFLLILITLAIIGAAIILTKTKKKTVARVVIGFLTTVSAYFVIAFFRTPLLITFNVPDYYDDAKQYLEQTHAQRILILPGFYGTYPTYNATVNKYYGVDFIPYLWPYQILEPNSSDYGVGSPTKSRVNEIVSRIQDNKSVCDLTKRMGISHIVIKQDIDDASLTEGSAGDFLSSLQKYPEISDMKAYNGIIILKLQQRCAGIELISVNSEPVKYRSLGLSTIQITTESKQDISKLVLISNETTQWHAYTVSDTQKYHPILALFNFYPEAKKVKSADGTRNIWEIPPSNNDEIMILQYQAQAYFLIGFWILIATQLAIVSLVLYGHAQRNHKESGK